MPGGKHILIGVTGGIAAYKIATAIRLFVKEGAEVRVIMTPHAKDFITPLTLATLSGNPVFTDFFDPENGNWNSHVGLALWADVFLIAPATANTIAKMATGVADNLLLTTYLSARCPVFIAPAMDMDMLAHPATTDNLETMRKRGHHIIDAGSGFLASGLSGKGRMAEPEEIVEAVTGFLSKKKRYKPLTGLKVMINAGPTIEPIDPVRFLSNYSTGRMGIALADAAAAMGAGVTLVLGPVSLSPKNSAVKVINVTTAESMAEASVTHFRDCDIAILSAAVADFSPVETSGKKIKRGEEDLVLRLRPTKDIAAELGRMKKDSQILAGFALETHSGIEHARAKLERKNLDLVVLNMSNEEGSGFGHDTNRITIIDKNNNIDKFELKSKDEAARDILEKIVKMMGSSV